MCVPCFCYVKSRFNSYWNKCKIHIVSVPDSNHGIGLNIFLMNLFSIHFLGCCSFESSPKMNLVKKQFTERFPWGLLYWNNVNLWRAWLLLNIAYFTALHALGLWLAVNKICCCWGGFHEWICAVCYASSASQESHSSKVYMVWL